MKTDYRVICCIVAWLCCAAVDCRKDWDNLDGNRIEQFGREYDDIFDDLRLPNNSEAPVEPVDPEKEDKCKAKCGEGYEAKEVECKEKDDKEVECTCKGELVFDYGAKECKDTCQSKCGMDEGETENTVVKCEGEPGSITCKCVKDPAQMFDIVSKQCVEDMCKAKCGEGYADKGVECKIKGDEEVECTCTGDLVFDYEAKECKVTDKNCDETYNDCRGTGGSCVINEEKKIICQCPVKTTLTSDNKCKVTDEECAKTYKDCRGTGGSCVLNKEKKIICQCPEKTTLTSDNKCMVEDKDCDENFPKCRETGGTCVSKQGGVICQCPDKATLDTENKCIDCECGDGAESCSIDNSGVKTCVCKEKFLLKDGKCHDTCQSKCGLGKDQTENEEVKCEETSDSISCLCKKNPSQNFDTSKKQCVDTCGSICGLGKDQTENDDIKCSQDSGTITCQCKKGTAVAFDYTQKQCVACECGDKSKGCKFEGGKKTCLCEDKFADKQGKCSDCDCGPNSRECKFNADKKVCSCKKGYEDKDGTCKMTKCTERCGEGHEEKGISCKLNDKGGAECKCKEPSKGFDYIGKECKDCDCGPNSTGCLFVGEKKVCTCKKDHADKEGTCTACDCGKDAEGCSFLNGKTCKCKEKDADKNGKCENCKCGEFSKGCSFKGDEKYCDCKTNYADNTGTCQVDYCQIKCGCDLGGCKDEDLNCEGDQFKEAEVKCMCSNEKKFDDSKKIMQCRIPCKTKEDCKHGAECLGKDEVKFCSCPEGTSGDACLDVKECAKGGKYEKCEGENGTCGFQGGKAVCTCENGKKLDEAVNYCVDKFCFDKNCKDNSTCNYDTTSLTGYCVCPNGKYYDYKANSCKVPDKCLLKKTACKENEICEGGECKCPYEKEDDKCISKFCKSKPCFQGADCNEADGSCTCAEGKYFTGSRCENKTCIMYDDYAEKCPCPALMERGDDKKCVPTTNNKPCDRDCGYGHCVNNNCRCFVGAETKDKICVLKKTFCASGELVNGSQSQCKCTGKYKQAKDGKTCELVTCEDESAKSFCAQKGATCRMKWKGTPRPQFECDCPDGYTIDTDRDICSDACSMQKNIDTCLKDGAGRFCFSSNSKENLLTGDCRCPPPFTNTKGCLELDNNTHLITGIPVLKKNYEMKNGINHVLLNTHLIQSLAQTYTSAVFDYGYLHDYEVRDKEIICSVWVRFKQTATEQLERLRFQASQFSEGVCDDCDTDMYVWPPALPLSKKLEEVHYENLNLCSTTVKDKLCGRQASCNDKSGCYCARGFKMLEYTYRLTIDNKRIQRCEATTKGGDLDECLLKTHNCSKNSDCVKIPGDFICQCKPGYWKENNYDKTDCQDLCAKKPCGKGTCSMKKDSFNCKCEPGYGGSLCDEKDVNFASAKKSTVIVGAVLGTILIVGIIAFLLYYRKIRKSSYSEDFVVAPSHSEMTERRPMRGITNKSYE